MQPTLLQGIQFIISCNSLLVEGGGNKYKVAGYTLYLAKLVASFYSLEFMNSYYFIIDNIQVYTTKLNFVIFNRF